MPKFRKKPIVIEAIQWKIDNFEDEFLPLVTFAFKVSGKAEHYTFHTDSKILVIHTLEGDMIASLNDWIVVGVNGEMYPCKPDVFEATYEPVSHDI